MTVWDLVHHFRRKAMRLSTTLPLVPAPLREAGLFATALLNLPRGLTPGDTLAGDFGPRFLAPERREALVRELAESAPSPGGPAEPTVADLMRDRLHCFGQYTPAHTLVDYPRVIETGLGAIMAEAQARSDAASGAACAFPDAVAHALKAVITWADLYAQDARERLQTEANPDARRQLELIAQTCAHVPEHPARTFHEAVQAVWLVHAAVGISELSDSSLSLGRLDQYLYPLYCADLARGVPEAELERSLRDLWRKLNSFGDPACTVNLGGLDEDGRDQFNPLSALILRVSREMRLPSPLLAARIHADIPQDVFDACTDPELLAMGQPTFYGEEACRETLRRRGVPEAAATRFAANSCMGIVVPGAEISDMWGGVVNMLLPLELATNGGEAWTAGLPIAVSTPPKTGFASFDDLFAQFASTLEELVAFVVEENRRSTEWVAHEQPNPFLSALIEGCLERGLDRADGGARYHSVIIEGFGGANAADALTAIQKLVFEEKRCSLAELSDAAARDWEGDEALHWSVLECPKYGNTDAGSDAMARRVTEAFAAAVTRHSGDGVTYLPSYHTLNAHIGAGGKLAASLDGRRRGEPLSKNVGPMLGRARSGLTAVLLSATEIDQPALTGGQALDISLPVRQLLSDTAGKRGFQALLQTYFARGGLEVQVNGLTADDLRAAIARPQAHTEMTVKIAGYSTRFVNLSREVQDEMVRRFEAGL